MPSVLDLVLYSFTEYPSLQCIKHMGKYTVNGVLRYLCGRVLLILLCL